VFTGFRKFNVQAVTNNLIWGLDHRIYGAGGTNGGRIASGIDATVPAVTISRNDYRFSLEQPTLELLSGGARFGNTFDDWGNRFICNIRNPVQHVVLPQQAIVRNPALNVGTPLNDVAVAGDQLQVFRASPPEPWRLINAARLSSQGDPRMPRSEKNAQGFMTSGCGVTIYRGDAYPTEFRQQVLLAEVAGNLIHRQKLEPSGVTFTSQRMDEKSEFLTSTDNWFRPVNFLHAPDGTLYVLDMYRETIEHPWSMPDDLKALLDLEIGRDRGRIYRLTPPAFQRRTTPRLSKATTAELVALLQHPNAWHRDTAHRLLFERQDPAAVPLLEKLLMDQTSELARLHALWSLEGMKQLSNQTLLASFGDSSAAIREQAVLLLSGRVARAEAPESQSDLLAPLLALANDPSPRVRFQVALGLGAFDDARCMDALLSIARRDAADPWIVNGVLSSSRELAPQLFEQLLSEPEFLSAPEHLPLLRQLATVTGVRKNTTELLAIGTGFSRLPDELRLASVTTEMLLALEDGLRRAGGRLSALWQNTEAGKLLAEQIQAAAKIVADPGQTVPQQLIALRMLSCADLPTVRESVKPLLSTQQAPELQVAAIRTLAAFQDDALAAELLTLFPSSTPTVQYEIIEAVANHPQRIPVLLEAIADGKQEVILRENIAEIKATGLSLMPEGFEKKITAREMADLIAFLRGGE